MYISELDLHGFKSFAYKTKVKFDKGITAIVGPNGCGKSNIVDALRWVLGEQRPTLLRSSSMSNVIFNGTNAKKAQGLAEVSLTLVNNKGLLPTEYSEITITRRLYRSGESEYLINNTPCRLKDIMELFMDTGMGPDAYSVIELKMVEEILNDRNNDRRRLFEEAAGVTRYKEKRKQTFRKLDETLKDLQRVEDILSEVRKKVKSLESQAEKADKAKSIRKELTALDKGYNKHLYLKIEQELDPLQTRIQNAEQEKKEIDTSLEKLEEKEEKSRRNLLEKERSESEKRRAFNQHESSIRELDTDLQITREKISNEKGVIRQYKVDIEQSSEDLEELKKLRDSSTGKLEKFSKELERSEESLKESRETFTDVQQKYTRLRHQLYELEIEAGDLTKELNELKTENVRLESRLENTEVDMNRISSSIHEIEQQIHELEKNEGEIEESLNKLLKEKEKLESDFKEASDKKKTLESERENVREDVRKLKSERDALASEFRLMRDLAESKDFFPSSVAYLTEHHSDQFDTLDVAGNLFHTEEKYAPALEAALGESINFLIVESMEDAVKASNILKQQDKGKATFIPLNELKTDYPSKKHSILSVVDVEKRYRPLAELLLGSVYLAEDIRQARRLLESGGVAAVTLDGELVTADHFLKSGSKSTHAGARLGLKDKMEKLEASHKQSLETLALKEKSLQNLQEQLDSLDLDGKSRELNNTDKKIRELEQKAGKAESEKQVYRKNINELKDRKERLVTSEDSARVELKNLKPREKELNSELDKLEKQQAEKKEELQRLEEERSIAQNRFNDAQLKHQDLKNKTENLERDIERAETGITNVKNRIESRQELSAQSKEKISHLEKRIVTLEEKLEEQKKLKEKSGEALKAAEEESGKQRGAIQDVNKELKELRKRKEVNLELIHHLTMAKEKFEMQIQSVSDHIWETYGLLMKQIDESLPEELDENEAKAKIGKMRQQLNQIGEVNPLAIEQFEEEKERLDFLQEQVGDLQDAEAQLQETIAEINEVATKKFNETFENIRTHFQSVFGTLFQEDDYCDLVIEEDVEDPLEAKIEIKANPRGKRPSNISQLSGGEKTLTAIALLFAIYLVKPSPFCVLDEVDAPLDDANIERFSKMIRNFSEETQFILITHNKKTMSKAEMMYGVTMPETGVSRLVGVQLDEVIA